MYLAVAPTDAVISSIQKGILVLVGISLEDTPECAEWMAKKLLAGKKSGSVDVQLIVQALTAFLH